MSAAATAQVLYKKNGGIFILSKDKKTLSWTPTGAASPSLTINTAQITNLQQTPPDKPKVMLKIFVQQPGESEAIAHTFQFTSATGARDEADVFKDALSVVLTAVNASRAAALPQRDAAQGQSAAMTIANALSAGRGTAVWEDDERLLSDVRLQQSLMRDNPDLQKTFLEARQIKPDSLSLTQFTKQFWTSRIHLLRAYALSQSQSKGSSSVFSEIKVSHGMSITADHIRAIFEQYPVMRIIYDEVVPKRIKSEADFWSRFFQSQLYNTLRGMKVDRQRDAKDPLLDSEYLDHPGVRGERMTSAELHIAKFIDLEGNEENHSQRQGNRPDQELRQSTLDKAPIIRRLNALSEKLMASVRPSDTEANAPAGMDELEYEQLRLRDLAGEAELRPIELNIRDQSRFFSTSTMTKQEPSVTAMKGIDPNKSIQTVTADLHAHLGPDATPVDLDLFDEVDEMDEEMADNSNEHEISGSEFAAKHILALTTAHREQIQQSNTETTTDTDRARSGLTKELYDRLSLTHATTLEFLRQFYTAFLSGDAKRVDEVASLVESLNRSLERINALAADAQSERAAKMKQLEHQAREMERKTGRKIRVDYEKLSGGETAVKQLLSGVLMTLTVAVNQYKTAYEEQTRQSRS